MLKQYCILTSCLTELRASNLPVIEKLRLELELIGTKQILLNDGVERRVAGAATSELEFLDFHDRLKLVCVSSHSDSETDKLMSDLKGIKDRLKGYMTGNGNCSSGKQNLRLIAAAKSLFRKEVF